MTTFQLEMSTLKNVKARTETELANEKAYNKSLIEDAVKNKSSMPEHYWQKEDKLARKLRAITTLIEILEGEM